MDPEGAVEPRHVSPLLATAIVAMPVLFTWLLLRRGYAPSTRRSFDTGLRRAQSLLRMSGKKKGGSQPSLG